MCVSAYWMLATSTGSSYLSSGRVALNSAHTLARSCRRSMRSCTLLIFSSLLAAAASGAASPSAPSSPSLPKPDSSPDLRVVRCRDLCSFSMRACTCSIASFCHCSSPTVRKERTHRPLAKPSSLIDSTSSPWTKAASSFVRDLSARSEIHAISALQSSSRCSVSRSVSAWSPGST